MNLNLRTLWLAAALLTTAADAGRLASEPAVAEAARPPTAAATGGAAAPHVEPDSTPRFKFSGSSPDASFRFDGERWSHGTGPDRVTGILVKPSGPGPFPAILISHGLGGSAESFALPKARDFVRKGYVCIIPNYTHSGRAVGAARAASESARANFGASPENLRRARLCADILRSLPEVDASRIFAYGRSMGGFVTIGLAASDAHLLAAAAITGSGVAPREGLPAPSTAEAARIRTPFLMLHGADDPVVRPERSELFKAVLDRNEVPNRH